MVVLRGLAVSYERATPVSGFSQPLSSKLGIYKTVTAQFWLCLLVKSPQNLSVCYLKTSPVVTSPQNLSSCYLKALKTFPVVTLKTFPVVTLKNFPVVTMGCGLLRLTGQWSRSAVFRSATELLKQR